jgi:hypothetical protein
VVRPPEKAKKRKKKKKGFGLLGVALDLVGHPQALGVGPATPKSPKPIFRFFFLGLLGVARPPPWAWGWFDHPRPVVGVALATLDFHLFHFFLFNFHLSLFFFFFFSKKKKKFNGQTTSFWAGWVL